MRFAYPPYTEGEWWMRFAYPPYMDQCKPGI